MLQTNHPKHHTKDSIWSTAKTVTFLQWVCTMMNAMVNIIKNDNDNLNFRYFNNYTRTIETVLQTHSLTNVYCNRNTDNGTNADDCIGYAHLDFDACKNRHWFGIYICKPHRGKKYGGLLLNDIIHRFCIETNYQTQYDHSRIYHSSYQQR